MTEYRMREADDLGKAQDWVNEMGMAGWELHSVTPYLCKRSRTGPNAGGFITTTKYKGANFVVTMRRERVTSARCERCRGTGYTTSGGPCLYCTNGIVTG